MRFRCLPFRLALVLIVNISVMFSVCAGAVRWCPEGEVFSSLAVVEGRVCEKAGESIVNYLLTDGVLVSFAVMENLNF